MEDFIDRVAQYAAPSLFFGKAIEMTGDNMDVNAASRECPLGDVGGKPAF